jgi:hypothetical protein
MTTQGVALAAIVILLFPMGYFLLASPAFLLVKLDIPEVAQLLRGMFRVHFLMVSVTGIIAVIAFTAAGHALIAVGIAMITALAFWGRRWFLQAWDAQQSAKNAGDAKAVRELRRLHWGGMLSNAVQLAAVVACIPYVASP